MKILKKIVDLGENGLRFVNLLCCVVLCCVVLCCVAITAFSKQNQQKTGNFREGGKKSKFLVRQAHQPGFCRRADLSSGIFTKPDTMSK